MLQRLVAGVAIAAVAAIALVGCTPEEPTETTPAATPAATPAESAPTEPVEESRRAWDAYQSRIAELEADPSSATLDSLEQVAQPDLASALLSELERSAALEVRTTGERVTTAFELVDIDATGLQVQVTACVDVSDVRVIDTEGRDRTPPELGPKLGYSVTLARDDVPDRFLVASADAYGGAEERDPCR